jgi:hypothetical protein
MKRKEPLFLTRRPIERKSHESGIPFSAEKGLLGRNDMVVERSAGILHLFRESAKGLCPSFSFGAAF